MTGAKQGGGPGEAGGGAEPLDAGSRARPPFADPDDAGPQRAGTQRSRGGAPTASPAGRGGTPRETDPFSLLGLPRTFRLEPGALERAVRDQARAWHPDRFARAEPRDRRLALERSTAVNDARRRLERWPSRAACLLSLAGHPPADRVQVADDPAFLESQLELREALESARAAGDAGALERLGAEIRARLAALEGEAARLFDDPGWPVAHAGALARVVARARFLEAVLADADRARSVGG